MGAGVPPKENYREYGFRIYKLIKDFPLDKAKLKVLEDFIIPPEDIFKQKITFYDWVKSKAGQQIKAKVYSLKERKIKEIDLQVMPEGTKEGYLGGSVKLENMVNAEKKLLHVINVKPNSFSDKSLGLKTNEDYFIAMRALKEEICSLNQISDLEPLQLFRNMIKENIGKKCEFYIYNKYLGGRCVETQIDNDDYFELGCDVAYGRLHQFPINEEIDKEIDPTKISEENGETQEI